MKKKGQANSDSKGKIVPGAGKWCPRAGEMVFLGRGGGSPGRGDGSPNTVDLK